MDKDIKVNQERFIHREEEFPPIMLGPHIDTVTVTGRYDGSYGVMAALEVINVLNEQQTNARRPLGMAPFTNPEELETGANVLLHAALNWQIRKNRILWQNSSPLKSVSHVPAS